MTVDELIQVKKLCEAVAAFYHCQVDFTERFELEVKTDNGDAAMILRDIPGISVNYQPSIKAQVPEKSKRGRKAGSQVKAKNDTFMNTHDPLRNYPEELPEEGGAPADEPTEGSEPRRVCRNCMKLFVPKRETTKCCSNNCNVLYNQRQRRIVALDKQYAFRNEHRHWFYGDEAWFDRRLKEGFFPEGSKILTPEGWLRVISMQAGQLTYDEIHAI